MMTTQKAYWDKTIKDWTLVSYGRKKGKVDLIEKLANLFRKSISGRLEAALAILKPMTSDKIIIDMGCGLGDLCFRIIEFRPRKVLGIDISPSAVLLANKIAKKRKLGGRVRFLQGDLTKMKTIPQFDIAVGLGFIDYFDKKQLNKLFNRMGDKYFLFSVFEKKLALQNLLHAFYIKLKKCPGAYKYTRKEIQALAPKKLKGRFLEYKKMLFFTNLPLR